MQKSGTIYPIAVEHGAFPKLRDFVLKAKDLANTLSKGANTETNHLRKKLDHVLTKVFEDDQSMQQAMQELIDAYKLYGKNIGTDLNQVYANEKAKYKLEKARRILRITAIAGDLFRSSAFAETRQHEFTWNRGLFLDMVKTMDFELLSRNLKNVNLSHGTDSQTLNLISQALLERSDVKTKVKDELKARIEKNKRQCYLESMLLLKLAKKLLPDFDLDIVKSIYEYNQHQSVYGLAALLIEEHDSNAEDFYWQVANSKRRDDPYNNQKRRDALLRYIETALESKKANANIAAKLKDYANSTSRIPLKLTALSCLIAEEGLQPEGMKTAIEIIKEELAKNDSSFSLYLLLRRNAKSTLYHSHENQKTQVKFIRALLEEFDDFDGILAKIKAKEDSNENKESLMRENQNNLVSPSFNVDDDLQSCLEKVLSLKDLGSWSLREAVAKLRKNATHLLMQKLKDVNKAARALVANLKDKANEEQKTLANLITDLAQALGIQTT